MANHNDIFIFYPDGHSKAISFKNNSLTHSNSPVVFYPNGKSIEYNKYLETNHHSIKHGKHNSKRSWGMYILYALVAILICSGCITLINYISTTHHIDTIATKSVKNHYADIKTRPVDKKGSAPEFYIAKFNKSNVNYKEFNPVTEKVSKMKHANFSASNRKFHINHVLNALILRSGQQYKSYYPKSTKGISTHQLSILAHQNNKLHLLFLHKSKHNLAVITPAPRTSINNKFGYKFLHHTKSVIKQMKQQQIKQLKLRQQLQKHMAQQQDQANPQGNSQP